MEKRSATVIFAFSSICLHFLALSIAQPVFYSFYCSPYAGIFTTDSPYQMNLNATLLSILSYDQGNYGFYNLSSGQEPDIVNTIALCSGDVSLEDCQSCLGDATQQIQMSCPNRKEASGWYTNCMIRYSNRMIFGTMETDPWFNVTNKNPVGDNILAEIARELPKLLSDLKGMAAAGDWRRKYAAGNSTGGYRPVFAQVQCTPDLTEQKCNDCLADAIGNIPYCCYRTNGARIYTPSCNIRFENYSFFNPTPELPPTPLVSTSVSPVSPPVSPPVSSPVLPTLPPPGNGDNTVQTFIRVIIPVVSVLLVTIVGLCIFLRWRKQKEKTKTLAEVNAEEPFQYNFNMVRTATNDFSDANKLGQGGFGSVYKGTLPNGQDIAVKRLSRDSRQGDLEFKNEVLLVAKLQHRNLVQLLGYCLEGNERLLIYEFVPNAGLDHFLFDPTKGVQLDWERRYKIIGGIARGLLYLHEDSLTMISKPATFY